MITRETRALCTACRFDKCVAVGMAGPNGVKKPASEETDSHRRYEAEESVSDSEDVAIISDDER